MGRNILHRVEREGFSVQMTLSKELQRVSQQWGRTYQKEETETQRLELAGSWRTREEASVAGSGKRRGGNGQNTFIRWWGGYENSKEICSKRTNHC